MALFSIQQQTIVPLGHLAAVWNTIRAQSQSVVTRGHRQTAVTLSTPEPVTTQDVQDSIKSTFTDLGLHYLPEKISVEALSPLLNTKLEGPATNWSESHISAESFFENKYGMSKLECEGLCHKNFRIQLPNFTSCLLGQRSTVLGVNFVPSRGFKTKRAGQSFGVQGTQPTLKDEFGEDQFSTIKYLRQSVLDRSLKRPGTQQKLKSMLSEEHSPELQEKMKIAFAEGYSANSQKDAEPATNSSAVWAKRLMRMALYALLVWVLIQLVQGYSALGGSEWNDVKINVLKGERYEINPEDITVKFEDVKGVDEAKQELKDVVEFLRDPDKFKALGAKLPKGVLLVGPPGIGKTLLARAVAGEANVPFFHASGSEFDEIFVGTGAKRVRQLFDAAKMRAPCVIFIDEIDTVGAKRTSSQIHPYANQTINQLLSEMDGFQQNEGVIVLGATNRRDNLDKALLRPGRFDVEVRVFPPDMKGRKDILEHYLTRIKVGTDLDTEKIARGTTGCTGADLENMVNQAALKAAMEGDSVVSMHHMEYAKDKVLMGPAKKTKITDEETNLCTAYHEAGHTLVAYYTKDATPLHKVTIIPRGLSLGHTSFVPDKEQYNLTKAQLLASMDVAMGGRVAEELIFGADKVTTGAGSDFQTATSIATAMVKQYGMSEKVGVRVISDDEVESGMSFLKVNSLSSSTSELVDSEIKRLLHESYERARTILKGHSQEHKALAAALMKYETLDKDDIKSIIEGKKFTKPLPKVVKATL